MVRGLLEDRAELEALFDELNLELGALGTTAQVVMVGGASLATTASTSFESA